MLINEVTQITEQNAKGAIIFYGGRFQPMHKGHRDVYEHLVKKFGSNVFIATTFRQKAAKAHGVGDFSEDPFTFDEKKKIMTTMFGIPADKIINQNPYRSEPSVVGASNDEFATVLVYGEKDAGRLGGGNILPLPNNMNEMTPHSEGKVYYYVAPLMQGGMSASDFRMIMATGKDKSGKPRDKKKSFNDFFGSFNESIFKFIEDRLT